MAKYIYLFLNRMSELADQVRINRLKQPLDINCFCDIPYLNDAMPEHTLDVYRNVVSSKKSPVIIDIHGGTWCYGKKEMNSEFCFYLVKKGFTVVNINYRLIPNFTFKDQIFDIFAVFEWVKNNADNYGFDLENIFLAGDSAGGHLAALAASLTISEKARQYFELVPNIKINAVGFSCTVFNPTEVTMLRLAKTIISDVVGTDWRKDPTKLKHADLNTYLDKSFLPSFIVSSYGDFLKKESFMMDKKLAELKVDHRFCFFKKKQGRFRLGHIFNVNEPHFIESKQANDQMCDFFKKYIKKQSAVNKTHAN